MILFIILATIGFAISLYTYLLEKKIKEEPQYKPFCDISDQISCSKPIQSEYSNVFYISNAIVGMLFYALVDIFAFFDLINLIFIGSIIACITSIILGYFLYFKIKSYCILCTSLYFINFSLLILSIYKIYKY